MEAVSFPTPCFALKHYNQLGTGFIVEKIVRWRLWDWPERKKQYEDTLINYCLRYNLLPVALFHAHR